MKTLKRLVLFWSVTSLVFGAFAFAEEGPHGGTVVPSNQGKVEIAVDSANHHLDVYLLDKPKARVKEEMRVKLGGKNSPSNVYLKAITPKDQYPHFRGPIPSTSELRLDNASQMGIQIQFGKGKKR